MGTVEYYRVRILLIMMTRTQNVTMGDTQLFEGTRAHKKRIYLPGKYIVIFGVFPALCLMAMVSFYWLDKTSYQPTVAFEQRENAKGQTQLYYPMSEVVVDLSPDLRGRTSYLKVVPSIAIDKDQKDKVAMALDEARPIIAERLSLFLRALSPDDFRSTEQLNYIKKEMTRRVNLVLGQEIATDVVLEQLVIQ